jgi:hypothetical protein
MPTVRASSEVDNRCDVAKRKLYDRISMQGCQMIYFQTENPNLGKFWSMLQWKTLVNFIATWSKLRPIGLFYGHLIYFVVIWYIFHVLVCST